MLCMQVLLLLLLLSLHLAHIDVWRIGSTSNSEKSCLDRRDMLVHCCVIYNVTTIFIMLSLVMVGMKVAAILLSSKEWHF